MNTSRAHLRCWWTLWCLTCLHCGARCLIQARWACPFRLPHLTEPKLDGKSLDPDPLFTLVHPSFPKRQGKTWFIFPWQGQKSWGAGEDQPFPSRWGGKVSSSDCRVCAASSTVRKYTHVGEVFDYLAYINIKGWAIIHNEIWKE